MDVFKLFSKNACSLGGKDSEQWTWQEYYQKKQELEKRGMKVILVDMIGQPVQGSVPISNELFENKYPDGTYFVLYCHSGDSSGFLQKKLAKQFPQYHIINMTGGIGMYEDK